MQITQDVLPHGTLLWHIASGHFDQDAWKHYILLSFLVNGVKKSKQSSFVFFHKFLFVGNY